MKRSLRLGLALAAALAAPLANAADPIETLRSFVRDVKSGHADFTQTVTSPDGARKKSSSGRPDSPITRPSPSDCTSPNTPSMYSGLPWLRRCATTLCTS